MNLDFSVEEKEFIKETRRFLEKEIAPVRDIIDTKKEFPYEEIKKLAEFGLLGVTIPQEYGGLGLNYKTFCAVLEEVSRVSASLSMTVNLHNTLASYPIIKYGKEWQKQKYLPGLARGEIFGAYAFSEPESGSDVKSQRTTAVEKGNYFILSGQKTHITNGSIADYLIVSARTNLQAGTKGFTLFIVDKKESRFVVPKIESKMALHTSPTCEIVFDEVAVPKDNVIGEINEGFKIAMDTLTTSRISLSAQAIGIAQAAFEEALKYSKERIQFGKRLCDMDVIREWLADMAVKLEASRLLMYKAAHLKDCGQSYIKEGAYAKLFATESASWICNKALQIHGGYGYYKDYRIERLYREIRVFEIVEGTSEIQRQIISKELLK